MKRILLSGRSFGRWVVLSDLDVPAGQKQPRCLCQCQCGTKREVLAAALRGGTSVSCGCAKRDSGLRHSHHPLFGIWHNMLARCYKKNSRSYAIYGGRGITVHGPWRAFPSFRDAVLSEIGPRPQGGTLDRIRTDEPYAPGNIRWASRFDQSLNRRDTRFVQWNGQSRKLVELCLEFRIRPDQVANRLQSGWTLESALITPIGSNGRTGRSFDDYVAGKTSIISR